jgi:hypothetical protein
VALQVTGCQCLWRVGGHRTCAGMLHWIHASQSKRSLLCEHRLRVGRAMVRRMQAFRDDDNSHPAACRKPPKANCATSRTSRPRAALSDQSNGAVRRLDCRQQNELPTLQLRVDPLDGRPSEAVGRADVAQGGCRRRLDAHYAPFKFALTLILPKRSAAYAAKQAN